MTEKKSGADEESRATDSIFRITDELVRQVDQTKKLVLVLIIAIIVSDPIIRLTGAVHIDIFIGIAFFAVGVGQWVILSRWTRRYRAYKELQRRVDEKLAFEKENSTDTGT